MGKRPIRIHPKDFIAETPKLIGQQAQVVLMDGCTYAGKLIECDSKRLVVEDANANWTNRKSHQHPLPFSEIQYIVIDKISAW